MNPDDLMDLIKTRRSIRKWLSKPVEEEKIKKILTAGVYAPSAANCQKTRFHVIRDKGVIMEICKNTSPWFKKVYPSIIIAVLFDLGKPNPQNLNYKKTHHAWSRFIWQDTAAAMMNMMLMAEALGLKTCWVSVIPSTLGPQRIRLRRLLNVTRRYVLACFLFVGYSDQKIDVNTYTHSGLPIKRVETECVLETLT